MTPGERSGRGEMKQGAVERGEGLIGPGGWETRQMDLPQAHRSTGFPYGSFRSTSGERYPGVPANPAPQTYRQADTHTEVGT